jgi:hypothetical protein
MIRTFLPRDLLEALVNLTRLKCMMGRVMEQKDAKTYNSGDSLVVTHLTTNPPVHCLYMAERTGSLIFSVLWSYVQI